MKYLKHTLALVFLIISTVFITRYNLNDNILKVFCLVTISLFIFNLIFRKSLALKKYFTSRYNVFTSKFRSEKVYDISAELMFEKIIEVINNSNFKLAGTESNNFSILATSSISFSSWGESLYINFDNSKDGCVMRFCSVTLFGVYSWGKNENNYHEILKQIDDSLTI